MKYLLDAPDEEMAEWKLAAAREGTSFAEWLRLAARDRLRGGRVDPSSRLVVAPTSPLIVRPTVGGKSTYEPDFKPKAKK